ncbi:MAG: cation-efflux pump, partial [Clostridium sp.]|nr:cation-efflux pump [Clostridium sp.]
MRRMCILQKIQQRLKRGLRGQGNGGRTDKDLALHVSWISILVNVALTIGKLSAGILAHSNAMISD